MSPKLLRWLLVVLGLLLAGRMASSFVPIRTWLRGRAADDLPTQVASRSTLTDSTVAIGTIKPKVGAEVKVGSQLSGVVGDLKVSVGDRVSRGQLLASLKDEDWRARAEMLRAELASSIAEKEYAASELQRTERLGELVSVLEVENTRKNLRVKEAQVERARANLAEAEITLGYTVIRAPVSGTIASVSTYRGETIAASLSAPTFVTILDLDRLEVQSYVDETDIGRIRVGQRVTFRVDAFPGRELDGVVSAIYPKAQLVNNVVDYVVLIDIVKTAGLLLRPEMTVHVNFVLDQREGVLTIPRSALLREGGRNLAVVRTADGWAERPVVTGLQTPQSVEIVSGLVEGETFVSDKQAWKQKREKKP
ncbi:MAG: efflux RND transporter periplasmic adaptor subunit [Thermoanaerobaculia bacterium]